MQSTVDKINNNNNNNNNIGVAVIHAPHHNESKRTIIDLTENNDVAQQGNNRVETITIDSDDDDDGDDENKNRNYHQHQSPELSVAAMSRKRKRGQIWNGQSVAAGTSPTATIEIDDEDGGDDDDDDVKVLSAVAATTNSANTDDSNNDNKKMQMKAPPPAAGNHKDDGAQIIHIKLAPRPKPPLEVVMEVFPDVHPEHVVKVLRDVNNDPQVVLSILAENGSYPKTKVDQTQNDRAQGVVVDRAVVTKAESKPKQYKHDYMSTSSFTPSKYYKKEAQQLLRTHFPFLSSHGAKAYLEDSSGHYAVAHQKISVAVMLRKGPVPKDPEEQYNQYLKLKQARVGMQLTPNQTKALGLPHATKAVTLQRRPRRVESIVSLTDTVLVDEERYVEDKFARWTTEMTKFETRLKARKRAEQNDKLIECECCYSSMAAEEMVGCDAKNHRFCIDCVKQYAESTMFGNGNLGIDPATKKPATDLLCMGSDGCRSAFPPLALKMALPEKHLRKYDELQFQAVLANAGVQDAFSCPKCSYVALLPETQKIFSCPVADCRHECCRLCGEEPHIPLRCDEVEKKTERKGRLHVEEAITEAKVRSCPKCGKRFVKESGCNKMTCSCGTRICYICRADITSVGYKHFCQKPHCDHKSCGGCALHTNAEQDDERAMREAGLRAAKEVKEGTETVAGVDVDVDAILHKPAATTKRR